MLQYVIAYITALGPYFAVAIGLGLLIPFLLLTTKPDRWLVPFMVLFLCLVPFGGTELTGQSEGSLFRQIGWGMTFLVALYFAMKTPDGRYRFPFAWVPIPYLLLLAYVFLSIAWSGFPLVSAKRAVQLIGVVFIALAINRHITESGIAGRFAWPIIIFMGLGAIATLALPILAFDPDGNFKGITFTKNNWGQFTILAALSFLFLALNKIRPRLNWLLFILASASLVATHSATSIAVYLIVIFTWFGWLFARHYGRTAQVTLLGLALTGTLVSFGYFIFLGEFPVGLLLDASLASAGKDATLTGRTELWQMLGYEIDKHPWFGIGYGGFWLGLEGPSVVIVNYFSWKPGQAHSGYIDIVNELGYTGLAIFLLLIAAHIRNVILLLHQNQETSAFFHFMILMVMLLLNITETSFIRTTHIWWIMLSISIVSAHVQLLRIREHAGQPCNPGFIKLSGI